VEHESGADAGGEDLAEQKARRNEGVALATQVYLLGVLLPLWVIPGFGDWVCHRSSKIEQTSGTHESLTHSLMMTSVGIPALMALVLEINASTIAALTAGFFTHEIIVIWDVAYAADRRHVSTTEQHFHSFLEVLPFMSLSFIACQHWDEVLGMLHIGTTTPHFELRLKEKPVPAPLLVGALTLLTATIAIPYAEELIRCWRQDHTLLPRPKRLKSGGQPETPPP
jgi:hypothetical protein